MTLKITVRAPKGTLIKINVMDDVRPDTCYSSTTGEVRGSRHAFYIPLPISPEKGYMNIFTVDKHGKKTGAKFTVVKKQQLPLITNFNLFDTSNPMIFQAVDFFKDFVTRASFLSAGKMNKDDTGGSFYTSNDGQIVIQYVDEIIDWCPYRKNKDGVEEKNPNYGKAVATSMRINSATGQIQCSKKYMLTYSIPERMAILLHEFSHYYLNRVQKNEYEADFNAILIYFGLGFSKREGGSSFWKVFERTPSNLNVKRMHKLIALLNRVDNYSYNQAA